jgi:hypothetical protein
VRTTKRRRSVAAPASLSRAKTSQLPSEDQAGALDSLPAAPEVSWVKFVSVPAALTFAFQISRWPLKSAGRGSRARQHKG